MLRALLAVIVLIMGTPAFAQDEIPTVDLFAKAVVGFVDGEGVALDGRTRLVVRQLRAGVFQVMGPDKKSVLFAFLELEPCVIEVISKSQPGKLRVDVRLLTRLTIEPRPAQGEVAAWERTIYSPLRGITVVDGDNAVTQTDLTSTINTSVSAPDMEAAGDALLARCASESTQLPGEMSSVDLLAVIFAGVAEGVPVTVGGGETGVVDKVFDGLYRYTPTGGTEVTLSIREARRCRFTFGVIQEGEPALSATLDANLISAITPVSEGTQGDLRTFKVTIDGAEGVLTVNGPDGPSVPPEAVSHLTTGLTLEDLEAAIGEFRTEYCPGLAG
jgi:hypothetical protein